MLFVQNELGYDRFNKNADRIVRVVFQVFTLPFLKGDPKTALLDPNSIVISEKVAMKYFGNEDPIGKVLNFKDWNSMRLEA